MDLQINNFRQIPRTLPAVISWIILFYCSALLFSKNYFFNPPTAIALSAIICSFSLLGLISYLMQRIVKHKNIIWLLVLSILTDICLNLWIQRFDSSNILLHFHAGINLSLLGIALCSGILLARIVEKASYIIPLIAAAGIADLWSVTSGVTNTIIQSETAMNFFLFTFPVAEKGIIPLLGVTDFIFSTLFLSLSWKFNMNVLRSGIILASSFAVSVLLAVTAGIPVPVLPIMGVLFVIGQYQHLKIIDPKEKKEALIGIVVIITAFVLINIIKR